MATLPVRQRSTAHHLRPIASLLDQHLVTEPTDDAQAPARDRRRGCQLPVLDRRDGGRRADVGHGEHDVVSDLELDAHRGVRRRMGHGVGDQLAGHQLEIVDDDGGHGPPGEVGDDRSSGRPDLRWGSRRPRARVRPPTHRSCPLPSPQRRQRNEQPRGGAGWRPVGRGTPTSVQVLERLDRFQQRQPVVALPIAVSKRFGEHDGSRLAATLSYYCFFSVFPLMLVFVTVLGIVLDDNDDLREDLIEGAVGRIPLIGSRARRRHHLRQRLGAGDRAGDGALGGAGRRGCAAVRAPRRRRRPRPRAARTSS